jgi:serine/threonine protein kinase
VSGETLGHFEILDKLGEGGMGVLYRARDSRLGRTVAIKVLRPAVVADPERTRRFVQEARAVSALNHPNIVTIHDIGEDTALGTASCTIQAPSSSSRISSGLGPRPGWRSGEDPVDRSRQARLACRKLWFRAAVHR